MPSAILHDDAVDGFRVRAYLSGIARNKTKEKTREMGHELPLEDNVVIPSDSDIARDFEEREQAGLIRRAVLALSHPDSRKAVFKCRPCVKFFLLCCKCERVR